PRGQGRAGRLARAVGEHRRPDRGVVRSAVRDRDRGVGGGAGVRVAVLGLGRMGTAMATALAEAGHEVTAWNRTPRTLPFCVNSMAEAIAGAEIIVVMVIDGPASQAVLDQITGSSALIVNASTVAPDESRAMAAGAGLRYLEAPVLGSVPTLPASGRA